MLDKVVNFIVQRLAAYTTEVNAKREAIEKERAGDVARDHAGREFVHPEGYTTPLPRAAQMAQERYARARRDFEKADVTGALAAVIALMIARERRDETAAALKAYLAAEDTRKREGVHPEVKPFFADMFEMGIEPRRLPYVRAETLAVISDMIMWDGNDPEMQDPASPMPAIFELYSNRLILKPGQFGDRSRSTIGTPARQVRYSDPEYFMFNELVGPTPGGGVLDSGDGQGGAEDAAPTEDTEADTSETSELTIDDNTHVFPITLTAAASDTSDTLSPEDAKRIAEAVFDGNPFNMRIYWPKEGYEIGDFSLERLIPALEQRIDSGDAWSGVERFLAAARLDEARQFIESERRTRIEGLAAAMMRGDERSMADARAAGFNV